MANEVSAPAEAQPRTYSSAAERFAEQRRLVAIVAACYRACKEAPVVVAFNVDPTPGTGSSKWTPQTAEYICDVELAIRKALQLKPETERNELHDAWERFVEDDTRIDATQRRVILILGGSFYVRELHPGLYFKPSRATRRP